MYLLYFILLRAGTAQLTVGGWFFPVSVAPPDSADNTVYDEDVGFPAAEMNITHQEIKDYYEKDKLEKWNSQRPSLQPVFKNSGDMINSHHNDNDVHLTTTTSLSKVHDRVDILKSKNFLPDSGIPNSIPTPIDLAVSEEPIITMSMSPIRSLNKPEEISVNDMNNSFAKKAEIAPESDSVHTAVPTTKVPFIYEIAKTKSFDDPFSVVEREKDMMKLKRDVFRLRNEMNLVKSLLNKLYKKSYKKQKEFLVKRNSDSTTRLSAVQADRNHSDWVVIRGKVLRAKNRHTNVD